MILHRSFPRKWANNRASSRCKALRSRTSRTSASVTTNRARELLAITTTAFKGQSPSARLGDVAAAAIDGAAHEESRLRHNGREDGSRNVKSAGNHPRMDNSGLLFYDAFLTVLKLLGSKWAG
jgi:hypothetical protein